MSLDASPQSGNQGLSRRRFLKQAAGAAAIVGFPTIIPSGLLGADAPSNRITVGGVGMGSQGMANMRGFFAHSRVQWLAVCDVDSNRLATARKAVDQHHANSDCTAHADFRDLLAREDIDAVAIATPDHWHALIAIAAARAGKDIHGEKPLSHDLREGRAVVRAVEAHGRIWQTGSWQRSESNFHHACELVRNGRIGKVVRVEVGLPVGRPGLPRGIEPVPPNLDWDMWLGPAPWVPYRGVAHWDWRWVLDWGGGQLVDWIGHHLDIAHWALDLERTGPVSIDGKGVFPSEGLYNAPTEYEVECRYASGVTIVVGDAGRFEKGMGTRWIGADGRWIWVTRDGVQASNPPDLWHERIGPEEIRLYHSRDHIGNFLDCVRNRRPTISPVETAHRSASVGHLGLASIMAGRPLKWDPAAERLLDDPGAEALLGRAYRQPWSLA